MDDSGWRDLHTKRPLSRDRPGRQKPVADQLFIGCLALLLIGAVVVFLFLAVVAA